MTITGGGRSMMGSTAAAMGRTTMGATSSNNNNSSETTTSAVVEIGRRRDGGGGGAGLRSENEETNNKILGHPPPPRPPPHILQQAQGSHHRSYCAINFYGLPRAFKSLVLPSVVENVIKPNAAYRCDYFLHYHNLTYEKPGRSGNGGGPIHPEDVFLLQRAVEQVHDHYEQRQHEQSAAGADETSANNSSSSHYVSRTPPPVVRFSQHTDEQLRAQRRPVLDQILSNNRSAYYPWRHNFTKETVENIVKMWHGQEMVWDLMRQREQRLGANYSRVAMLRSDMVFLTPIDIYRRGKQQIGQQELQHQQQRKQQQRTRTRRRGRNRGGRRQQMRRQRRRLTTAETTSSDATGNDDFSMDWENNIAVVPGFAKYPVNDRMIYGPRRAVQIWASERFQRLEDHVRYVQKHPRSAGAGIHSEKFVARTIFPAIERSTGTVIEEHPGICFVRARADETIWIGDCELARGGTTPPDKRQLWPILDRRQAVAERLIGRTCRTIAGRRLECGSQSSQ